MHDISDLFSTDRLSKSPPTSHKYNQPPSLVTLRVYVRPPYNTLTPDLLHINDRPHPLTTAQTSIAPCVDRPNSAVKMILSRYARLHKYVLLFPILSRLSQMALDFLSIPPTSADVERGLTISKLRHSLTDKLVRGAMVVSSWAWLEGVILKSSIIEVFKGKTKRPKKKQGVANEGDSVGDAIIATKFKGVDV